MVRCVEKDLKEMAQKLFNEHSPHPERAMLRLEKNITLRGVKIPRFKFNIKGDSVQPVSLSGRDAQLILAETEALESAGCCPLSRGTARSRSRQD